MVVRTRNLFSEQTNGALLDRYSVLVGVGVGLYAMSRGNRRSLPLGRFLFSSSARTADGEKEEKRRKKEKGKGESRSRRLSWMGNSLTSDNDNDSPAGREEKLSRCQTDGARLKIYLRGSSDV